MLCPPPPRYALSSFFLFPIIAVCLFIASCSSPAGGGGELGTEPYTVTFKSGYDENATLATKSVTPAGTIGTAEFPANPARAGYHFGGWYTVENGGGTAFTASTPVNADTTVYALWGYRVSFDKNTGDTEADPAEKIVSGTTGTLPVPPTKTGYAFNGWNTDAAGSGSAFEATTPVNADITVYAQWSGYNYTVTFQSNDGTGTDYETKTVASPETTIGTTDFPATNPSRSGYLFSGWNTQADGSGDSFNASTTVTGNITVYAQWTEVLSGSSTVTFRLNDGTENVHANKTVTPPATTIDAAEFPANPTRSGYIFAEWNTQPGGGGSAFDANTTVTGDITVYAKWDSYSHTVTFNSDSGTTEADPTTKIVTSPATTVDSLPTPPAKTGYRFGGWYTAQDGGGTAFTAATAVTGAITVYAKWNSYSYTVRFDKNDGDTDADPANKAVNSPATNVGTLPAVSPTRSEYAFAGWNTQTDGGGTAFDANTTVTDDITVYAKWIYSYTVTFDSDGGTEAAPATKTVTDPANTVGTLPTPPTKPGYHFGGWYTEQNGGGTPFDASTTVGGSRTVYARWGYQVRFDKNGGDTEADPAERIVSPGLAAGTLPAPPTRDGYAFAGWNTLANGTGTAFTAATTVSADITVHAQWSRAEITFQDPEDDGDGAFEDGDFTLSKGANDTKTITITGTGYTNPRWLVDGILKETNTEITIDVADYSLGPHNLSLLVTKNGVTWSRDIAFTVEN